MRGYKIKGYKPIRPIYKLIFELVTIPIIGLFLPGIYIESYFQLVILITVTSAVFAITWPFIAKYLVTILLYSAGLLNLLITTLVLWLFAQLLPGIHIDNLFTAFLISILILAFRMLADAILQVGEEGSFYRIYTKREAYKNSPIKEQLDSGVELETGTIFIEIDGLAASVLKFAVRNGYMPALQKLMNNEEYKIKEWVCEYGASTPVCQAGILQGSNENMPAFRWFDRKKQKIVIGNNPYDSANLWKSHSNGDGLLADYGLSVGNIFTGDAQESAATFSTLTSKKKRGTSNFYYYFLNPDNYLRSFLLFWVDIFSEIKDQIYLQIYNIQPRMKKKWSMPFIRSFLTIFMRDMLTSVLIGKMYEGIKSAYIVYAGYDFVAHENGLERSEAVKALTQADRKIRDIMRAAESTPRKYKFVFLSDHGQSQGASFKQRYGFSVEQYISQILHHSSDIVALNLTGTEAVDQLSLIISELAKEGGLLPKIFRKKKKDHYIDINEKTEKVRAIFHDKQRNTSKPEIICLYSGNQAELYFKGHSKRLTLERINKLYPELIDLLKNHEGIGFISVMSEKDGALAIGSKGTNYLDKGKVKGSDPLADFDKYAPDQLKRVNTYETAADIIINSAYYKSTDEVAAFEEFVSSHGGIGGGQTKPFVMFPADFEFPTQTVYRSTELHKILKGWVKTNAKVKI